MAYRFGYKDGEKSHFPIKIEYEKDGDVLLWEGDNIFEYVTHRWFSDSFRWLAVPLEALGTKSGRRSWIAIIVIAVMLYFSMSYRFELTDRCNDGDELACDAKDNYDQREYR